MWLSANLGFLFTDLSLPEAIRTAKAQGFDAVECHFPFDQPEAEVSAALKETGLPMLGLNTWLGDRAGGDFGLCALPDRREEARAAIDQAIAYARKIGCGAVHVMAGRTDGAAEAEACFREALSYACATAPDLTILIEPLNYRDVPGYHLVHMDHAARIIDDLGQANLRIMYDLYHTQIMRGDLTGQFTVHRDRIGHIQIASAPDRGEPGQGEVDLLWLCRWLEGEGWHRPIGAEYKPRQGETLAGLGWMTAFKDQ
ncbi:TIM barrel protein [Roseobacter sp. HKCCD9010]|uniref:hydroxypyruvate isomerase family protein n=1 Tax=unclassified Roseobacter TaxID=196798 RepID=UPI0014909EC0|nr:MULTISPECIES: TIM barrel protein [unclassified Roseobacter]MBF9052088.1 TIM barrel protein [Rhodobacterales bacterium HKCCD4356]NNV14010.1 TIM barrel protein [Roseobacter sp. HKCCD7357]NNV18251.1 TIM barrel protein [Roseobacter sp. HKCCD8768]NNV27709.1 TIM barrel protein [Roseobacter sp. HKCCD8192]NNV31952.1 TIM barrel protein [Roseobacter sp. HKCCD9061]